MKTKTKSLTFMAILIAIMLIFGFTPIGYIPLPFAKITLMCLPVIIGTLVLGLRTGMGLALVFIITSLFQLVITPDELTITLMPINPALYLVNLIVPRLFIPITTYFMYRLLAKKNERAGLFVASAVGSLTNTLLVLILLQLFFAPAIAEIYSIGMAGATAMIWGIFVSNGILEAVVATMICPFVIMAVRKVVPPITENKKTIKEAA